MALPSDLSAVTISGTYLDASGAGLPGTITFTPSGQLTDTTGTTVIPAFGKKYSVAGSGKFTTDPLVATDNADIATPWSYLVTLALQNLPTTTWNVELPAAPFSFTATNATPCVFTAAGSAYVNGTAVKLTGGSLPAGFTAGTTYFVVSASGTSFSLAATSGGSAIASTSTGSGTVSTASLDISSLNPVFTQLAALQFAQLLLPTGVQSGSITAAAGQLVLVTTASGNATVSLPTGVEAGSQVGVKMVVLGGSNTVAISCTGTDKFNVAGGGTTLTLSMLDQGMGFIYTGSVWVVANDDVPLGQLDARYMTNLSQTPVKTANYTAAANQLVPCNTSAGGFTVTLPTAPTGGTLAGVAMSGVSGVGVNALTVATGGSDVFDVTGGGTSATLTLLHQAVLWEYNSGVWAKVSSADPYLQVAQARQGTWYLDQFAGSDDQKMTSALAALFTAGGGTIALSPRSHTFASQWTTTGTQATPVTIRGAGAIAMDSSGTTSYGGATVVNLAYSGAGAARMDFQHRGSIEITGILFQDSGGSSVPFFQTTLAVPNVHHNAFIGSATGTACFQDAIVLGGFPGTGSGDTAQYDGYQGAVYANSFSGIRRAVLVNPAANSVQVWGNTIGETCGSNLPLGAAIELLGTSTLKVLGCWVYGNCIEETFYQVAIKGTWAQFNTLGPNGLFDAGAMYAHHYLDANSVGNVIIMGEGSGSVPAVFDAALTSTVIQAVTGAQVIGSVTRTAQAFYGVPPVVQANGQGVLGSDVQGDYGTWRTGFDQDGFPLIQAFVIPGTKVADGSTISGSNVVTSLTAAWTANDLGVYISGTNLVSGSVIMLTWNATTGPDWQASTAYAAGQVVTPASNNGHLYQCTTAGTSGSSQPTFPTNGTTVTDGTAVWTDIGASSAVQVSNNATGTGTALAVRFGRKGTSQSMTSFCRMHMLSNGTAPTVVAGAAGPAGTGATASVAGNDMCHTLTLNTGTGSLTAGVVATVTFNLSYDAAPKIQLACVNANAPAAMAVLYATKATGSYTLTSTSALAASTTYILDVVTIQ